MINTSYTFDDNYFAKSSVSKYQEMPVIEAAYNVIVEDAQNWNSMIEALAINEYSYLKENGTEIVYEAEDHAGIFARIADTMKAWFRKIADIIDGAIKKIQILFTKGKVAIWLKLHEKELAANHKKIYNFKGYSYGGSNYIDLISLNIPSVTNYKDIKEVVKMMTMEIDGVAKKLNCKEEEITSNKIKDYMLGEKISLTQIPTPKELIKEFKEFGFWVKKLETAKKEAKNKVDIVLRKAKDFVSGIEKGKRKPEEMRALVNACSKINSINSKCIAGSIAYINVMISQEIAIAKRYLAGGDKKPKNESSVLNALDNFELV